MGISPRVELIELGRVYLRPFGESVTPPSLRSVTQSPDAGRDFVPDDRPALGVSYGCRVGAVGNRGLAETLTLKRLQQPSRIERADPLCTAEGGAVMIEYTHIIEVGT